jgi:hypothetical protein
MRATTPSSRQLNHESISVFVADERWSLFASKMTPCAGSASQGQLPINILTIGEGLVFLRRVAGGPKQVPAVGYTLVLGGRAIHTNGIIRPS